VALAFVVRLVSVAGAAHSPIFAHLEGDPQGNDAQAWAIASGGGSGPIPLFRAPLYSYFLAAVYALFGRDLYAPRIAQALLGAGTVWLLGAIAATLWGRRTGIVAAVLAALYGPLVYFGGELVPVTLEISLTAASVLVLLRAPGPRAAPRAAAAGLLLAASATAGPAVLPFALAGTVWLRRRGPGSGAAAAYLIAALSLPLAAAAWNATAGHDAGLAISPAVHAGDFLKNVALVWNRRELPCDLDQKFFAPFQSVLFRIPCLFGFGLLAPIALVAAWTERRRAGLLVAYLAIITVVAAALSACDRLRLPLTVSLIPFAAAAAIRFFEVALRPGARRPSWPSAIAQAAAAHRGTALLLAGAYAFVLLPFPGLQATQTGPSWYRLARAYTAGGDFPRAWTAFRSAEGAGLRSAEFFNDFGAFELHRGASLQAEIHFRKALALDSRLGGAHANLAEVYMRRRQWDLAAQEYEDAAALIPEHAPELYTNAGTLYANIGRTDTARRLFARALKVRPGYEPALEGMARVGAPGEPSSR
jgi:tetratricopeptide (TPR) repeat protein